MATVFRQYQVRNRWHRRPAGRESRRPPSPRPAPAPTPGRPDGTADTAVEFHSRIKQAERRFPELPLDTVVAHIDTCRKATDFHRKTQWQADSLDALPDLSRQQGTAIAGALAAFGTVQNEIDRPTG